MMITIKKTNRVFDTHQGALNHIRKIYDNMKEAFYILKTLWICKKQPSVYKKKSIFEAKTKAKYFLKLNK